MSAQLDLLDWLAVQSLRPAASAEPALLHRVDLARNMPRFYGLALTQDLFGRWCVERRWRRIGVRRGQVRHDVHSSAAAAQGAMEKLLAAKQQRGYHWAPYAGSAYQRLGDMPGMAHF